uniref:Uncharacterized protein n=1 Tax=Avena sativa TaxID=4498 RepID=A0ACD6A2I2_AVESA
MIRRYVHLIVDNPQAGVGGYSLRSIDDQPLFAAGATAVSSKMTRAARPPRPAASFEFARKDHHHTEFFGKQDRRREQEQAHHHVRHLDQGLPRGPRPAARRVPPARLGGGTRQAVPRRHVPPSAGGLGTPCFESLRFDDDGALQDWVWELLPSPPSFDDTPCRGASGSVTKGSYAAGDDGGTIWLSTSQGTYTFDTGAAATCWRKEGDWALPFDGRAQYVPDYGLYFGFTERTSRLCAAELVVGARASEPPVHRNVWYDVDGYAGTVDDAWPDVDLDWYDAGDGWRLARSYLTCLGGGRFCVTRFYGTTHDRDDDGWWCSPLCNVAVITAVEGRLDSSTGDLRMVKGASRCYKFSDYTASGWAL